MKKLWIVGVVILVMMMASCSKQEAAADEAATPPASEAVGEETPSVITIGYGIDIEGLNPYNATETKHNAEAIMYDTLLKYDNGEIKPNLAEEFSVSEDGKTYRLKLREDVVFHDGAVFNAEVVKANLEILKKNEMYSWFGVLAMIERIDILDDYTIEIVYSMPYKPALQELTMCQPMSMVSPNAITEDGITGVIGSGPYQLETYIKDTEYVFIKNENYWGEEQKFDKIVLKIITDPTAMMLALKNGDIDFVLGSDFITYDAFNQVKDDNALQTKVSESVLKTKNISLNSGAGILQDKNVRLAIQHAVNKQELCDTIFYGLESPADRILNKSLPYCDVDVVSYEYNVAKSVELLEEAGWLLGDNGIREKDGQPLKLKLIYPTDFIMNDMLAQGIKGYMAEIGVAIELAGNEMMTWYADVMGGHFDMCIENTYGFPYDPYTIFGIMIEGSSFATAKSGLADNAAINERIMEILYSSDDNTVKEAVADVLNKTQEAAIYLPISYQHDLVMYNDLVSDYTFGGLTEMIETENIQ